MGQAINRSPVSFNTSALGGTITGSFAATGTQTSADLPVGSLSELAIDINVSTLTGTAPTLQVTVNRKGVDGQYYQIYQGASIAATGKQSVSIGAGFSGSNTAPVAFGSLLQIVVVGGGTAITSAVYTISVIGK